MNTYVGARHIVNYVVIIRKAVFESLDDTRIVQKHMLEKKNLPRNHRVFVPRGVDRLRPYTKRDRKEIVV